MTGVAVLYPGSYQDSRTRFRAYLTRIRQRWPGAQFQSQSASDNEDLTIDWIEAKPIDRPEKLLVFTMGEHGVEGYVGSAMLHLFIEEYLTRLNPTNTGLLLVHAINAWGMKHWQRNNADNVDLNRNFIWSAAGTAPQFDSSVNPDYTQLNTFLNPTGPVGNIATSKAAFVFNLLGKLISPGARTLRAASLLGQYRYPQGIYYGGATLQPETQAMMALYDSGLRDYDQVVILDMHTGYGPRYQMTLVNSWLEPRSSTELAQRYAYPTVANATPSQFYRIEGDMIDYIYRLAGEKYAGKRLFATTFEFGTLGDSTLASLRSLQTLILANQMRWHGAPAEARRQIEADFRDLFFPQEAAWQEKAAADARQAFEGILGAEGY